MSRLHDPYRVEAFFDRYTASRLGDIVLERPVRDVDDDRVLWPQERGGAPAARPA